ncbi:CarD family transcriptional regulator [Alkalibacter saccharofermentans]|jgi:CarD family transcriptional regulator|uniref:Transcriptional regulator, CarD family n=1 Tax=Alkalibacter saccharofermentans DSM 14828 TaxID=1120975 RepID=A0A1M4WYV5_9FIRM|nr:CarD family transcriptional regulator [Alkalibacter saccharofermentans]SHE86390.1 transcriptional regulator, CarD family [Alkalibacter saccharofermentans DSM 14828]
MYKIGDKIVYPMHGAGIIEDIEVKEILGETLPYYVLKFPVGNMKIMVPVNNCSDLGIRDIVKSEILDQALDVLRGSKSVLESNWNRRYRENLDKIKSGDILDVAEVVKDLYLMDREKGLSTGEKKMLNNAKQILISELALARDLNNQTAEDIIKDCLKE